jgi:hypothetical protein
MQADREKRFQNYVTNDTATISKPAILGLSTAVVIGILMPILAPHMGHPAIIYHSILHLASLSIATFLSIISVMAYSRARGPRLFFMMLGFIALGIVELLYLLETAGLFATTMFSFSELGIEVPHIILLVMLVLFGLGVLKVSK